MFLVKKLWLRILNCSENLEQKQYNYSLDCIRGEKAVKTTHIHTNLLKTKNLEVLL